MVYTPQINYLIKKKKLIIFFNWPTLCFQNHFCVKITNLRGMIAVELLIEDNKVPTLHLDNCPVSCWRILSVASEGCQNISGQPLRHERCYDHEWCCQVDKYGTVQPHTLIRQWMDYQHWYDRTKLSLKDIHNIIFFSCMNPTAGSFTIDPRLQRHFMVFALRSVRTGNRFKESQLKFNRFYLKVLNNVSFFPPCFFF